MGSHLSEGKQRPGDRAASPRQEEEEEKGEQVRIADEGREQPEENPPHQ